MSINKQAILDSFQRELDEIERTTPMTNNYARITPEIISVNEGGGVKFDFIIYHYESKLWYGGEHHEYSFQDMADDEFVKENDRVWDVGCNSGYYTVWLAKVATKGTVISFDPFPWNAAATRANAKLNGLNNVTVHCVALGAKSRTVQVHTNTSDIYHTQRDGIMLTIEPPERYFDSAPTLLKIDVEGAEQELADTSLLKIPSLERCYIEMHPQCINGDPRKFLLYADKYGFSVHPQKVNMPSIRPRDLTVKAIQYYLVRDRTILHHENSLMGKLRALLGRAA
jgi:FkbM family methyltransferase